MDAENEAQKNRVVGLYVFGPNYSFNCGVGWLGVSLASIHAARVAANDSRLFGLLRVGDPEHRTAKWQIYRNMPPWYTATVP